MGKFHTQPYKNGRTRERARRYYYPPKEKPRPYVAPEIVKKQGFSLSKFFTDARKKMKRIGNLKKIQ